MDRYKKYVFSVGLFVLGYILAVFASWFTLNYELQSPIMVQYRLPIKARKMPVYKPLIPKSTIVPKVSPTPTQVPKSSQIEAFTKYLTDNGASNRERALAWIATKWQGDNLTAFDNIIKKESGYRADAVNEIGAGGICQAYPAEKMPCELSDNDLMCQLEWCNNYIVNRYKTPAEAWSFHLENNWF